MPGFAAAALRNTGPPEAKRSNVAHAVCGTEISTDTQIAVPRACQCLLLGPCRLGPSVARAATTALAKGRTIRRIEWIQEIRLNAPMDEYRGY
ncbi:hypothetical protein MAPG_06553 [Magnaporthiopsis poae ATCC 64411]|uniref:Uncharacterized protein n=1 Tax=Magnaporthiopsis poae (strain ATCC 64411 / 73-15) TaxID=644358 RepID=A0A0C4E2C2_MAGP6|nr:hypothetical protein MAPG_06553 [Magnaporthiopsis poae ATCC 64411]